MAESPASEAATITACGPPEEPLAMPTRVTGTCLWGKDSGRPYLALFCEHVWKFTEPAHLASQFRMSESQVIHSLGTRCDTLQHELISSS